MAIVGDTSPLSTIDFSPPFQARHTQPLANGLFAKAQFLGHKSFVLQPVV
jgi:hypothetical protein